MVDGIPVVSQIITAPLNTRLIGKLEYGTHRLLYRQDGTVDDELTITCKLMYLSMVICIYISFSAIGCFEMSVPFRGEILA